MNKSRSLQLSDGALWTEEILDNLTNNKSLLEEDIEKAITDAIAGYVSEIIDLPMLLEIINALKESKVKLTQDLKYIISDLSEISKTTDHEFIHNILIDALRKVTNK